MKNIRYIYGFALILASFFWIAAVVLDNGQFVGGIYIRNTATVTLTPVPSNFQVLVRVIDKPSLDGNSTFGYDTHLYVEIADSAPYYDKGIIWEVRFEESDMPSLMKIWVDNKKMLLILTCSRPTNSFQMNCKKFKNASDN